MSFKVVLTPQLKAEMRVDLAGFHPFMFEATKVWLLDKWKWLCVEKYDDSLDPEAHIEAYLTQANLFREDLGLNCWLFSTTLKELVLEWYYFSLQNFIDLFDTSCAMFSTWFVDCKLMVACSTSLHHVTQEDI